MTPRGIVSSPGCAATAPPDIYSFLTFMLPYLLLLAGLVLAAIYLASRRRSSSVPTRADRATEEAVASIGEKPPAAPPHSLSSSVHQLANDLTKFFDESARPEDLLANSDFQR